MKRKELTKTFTMVSNWKKYLVCIVYTNIFQRSEGYLSHWDHRVQASGWQTGGALVAPPADTDRQPATPGGVKLNLCKYSVCWKPAQCTWSNHHTANTWRRANAGLLLGQHRRRWASIDLTLVQPLKCWLCLELFLSTKKKIWKRTGHYIC